MTFSVVYLPNHCWTLFYNSYVHHLFLNYTYHISLTDILWFVFFIPITITDTYLFNVYILVFTGYLSTFILC